MQTLSLVRIARSCRRIVPSGKPGFAPEAAGR
jgi:hypothetical protein